MQCLACFNGKPNTDEGRFLLFVSRGATLGRPNCAARGGAFRIGWAKIGRPDRRQFGLSRQRTDRGEWVCLTGRARRSTAGLLSACYVLLGRSTSPVIAHRWASPFYPSVRAPRPGAAVEGHCLVGAARRRDWPARSWSAPRQGRSVPRAPVGVIGCRSVARGGHARWRRRHWAGARRRDGPDLSQQGTRCRLRRSLSRGAGLPRPGLPAPRQLRRLRRSQAGRVVFALRPCRYLRASAHRWCDRSAQAG